MSKIASVSWTTQDGIVYVTKDGKWVKLEEKPEGELTMNYPLINKQLRFLLGEVLTIVDASYPNEKQAKAVKDLVKDKFSSKMSWLYELCGYPENVEEISEMDEYIDNWEKAKKE